MRAEDEWLHADVRTAARHLSDLEGLARDAEAQYYNAQLLLNGKKVLSVWPASPTYALKKNWKYLGRKYTLKPGLYTWYVFPGYGARAAVHYGSLMGSRTFQIVR